MGLFSKKKRNEYEQEQYRSPKYPGYVPSSEVPGQTDDFAGSMVDPGETSREIFKNREAMKHLIERINALENQLSDISLKKGEGSAPLSKEDKNSLNKAREESEIFCNTLIDKLTDISTLVENFEDTIKKL
jgi:hypothetical protein